MHNKTAYLFGLIDSEDTLYLPCYKTVPCFRLWSVIDLFYLTLFLNLGFLLILNRSTFEMTSFVVGI